MKVLIIGIDGATWNVLDDFLLDNYMPSLKNLKDNGYSGDLYSTEPPTTSTAWTTLFTGCNPGKHGITGYQQYFFQKDLLSIINLTDCRVPNLWHELSSQGYKIIGINLPWTYPCQKVNGIIAAGFGCPGTDSQFTYPAAFKSELLRRVPDYDIMARCDWSSANDFENFRENIELVERSFQQKIEAAKLAAEKVDWDVMMVEFQDIDTLHHRIWSYLDKRSRDKYWQQRDRLFQMFQKLDSIIGELLDYSKAARPLVVVVSDHGGGRLNVEIRPNLLLHKWGYLKFKSPVGRMVNRHRRKLNSILDRQKEKAPLGMRQPQELNIDWKRSKAVVLHTATNGYLYINYKERRSFGVVSSPSEFKSIIKDLKKRFSSVQDPVTKRPLFTRVVTPQELYGANDKASEYLGDLILIPQTGCDIRTSVSRKKGFLHHTPADSIKGTHRYEGICMFSGAQIEPATDQKTKIVDIAPTIYAALGARLPAYLDGEVLKDIFANGLNVEYSQDDKCHIMSAERKDLSTEEQDAIYKQLFTLGYL